MTKSEVEETTYKVISNGGILAKLYFDVQSDKQENLQPLMVDLINNRLLKSPGVVYAFGVIDEPIKVEDLYSTNAQVTVLFKDLWSLVNVAFNFAPAGIEVLKPEKEYRLPIADIHALVLNISQISLQYSQYILSRVLSKEDYDKVIQELKNREELGKKFLEKKQEGGNK